MSELGKLLPKFLNAVSKEKIMPSLKTNLYITEIIAMKETSLDKQVNELNSARVNMHYKDINYNACIVPILDLVYMCHRSGASLSALNKLIFKGCYISEDESINLMSYLCIYNTGSFIYNLKETEAYNRSIAEYIYDYIELYLMPQDLTYRDEV